MSDYKTILGAAAILMTIIAHIPYLRATLNGSNKPHIFSWIIWTVLTFIIFVIQLIGGAGPAAWVTFMTGVMSLIITLAAFRIGDKDITTTDWVMFFAGVAAIPLWIITDSPFWSMLLVTGIDCLAFGPTFRKAWRKPFEENSFAYGFNIPRHITAILSITHVSMLTAFYPAALLAMNIIMYVMLKTRRRAGL